MQYERPNSGRDERNLLEFPIGVSGKSQPLDEHGQIAKEIVRRVEVFDDSIGQVVPKQLTIRTSSKHAFVTGYDVEVLMGLFSLHHQRNKFATAKLEFENQELYRLMKWPKGSGTNNERLQIALDRFAGVQLTFENSFSADGGKTTQKTYSTGVLDSYQFTRTRDKSDDGSSWIRWSGELFVGFKQGNIKPLDTEAFFSLKRPVSQQAYRLLDEAFQSSDALSMDIQEFATRVGVGSKKTGVIKQRLQPVIKELELLPDFIEKTETERYAKQSAAKWTIHFTRVSTSRLTSKSQTDLPSRNRQHERIPAELFVREFYLQWRGERIHRVLYKERHLAEHLLSTYQADHLREATPAVVKALKLWKDAKTFGATSRMWHEHVVRVQRRSQQAMKPDENEHEESAESGRQAKQERQAWRNLPNEKRFEIINRVRTTTQVEFVKAQIAKKKYDDPLVEGECISLWRKSQR